MKQSFVSPNTFDHQYHTDAQQFSYNTSEEKERVANRTNLFIFFNLLFS